MAKLGCIERFMGLDHNLPKRYRAKLWQAKDIYENCDRSTLIRLLLGWDLANLELEDELKEQEGQL